MSVDRRIVLFLGGAVAMAVILRLALGPLPVTGMGDIYAVARGTEATAATFAVADADDKALFPH